jgi:hypothetical protein
MEYEKTGMVCVYRLNANYMHRRTAGWDVAVEYSSMHAVWKDAKVTLSLDARTA